MPHGKDEAARVPIPIGTGIPNDGLSTAWQYIGANSSGNIIGRHIGAILSYDKRDWSTIGHIAYDVIGDVNKLAPGPLGRRNIGYRKRCLPIPGD